MTIESNDLPPRCHGRVAIMIEVPESERANPIVDIAEAYCVQVSEEMHGGCIVWGKYHGKWVANVSARWLLTQFITGVEKMIVHKDSGGDGWWDGWNKLSGLVVDERNGEPK